MNVLDLQNHPLGEPRGGLERIASGSRVLLQDLAEASEWEVLIVDSEQADPAAGRISDECPIGEALLGRREGETIQVEVPLGTVHYRIIAISQSSYLTAGGGLGQPQLPARSYWDEP